MLPSGHTEQVQIRHLEYHFGPREQIREHIGTKQYAAHSQIYRLRQPRCQLT